MQAFLNNPTIKRTYRSRYAYIAGQKLIALLKDAPVRRNT